MTQKGATSVFPSPRRITELIAAVDPELVRPRERLRPLGGDHWELKAMIDGECRRGLEQLLHLLSHVLNVNGRAHNLAGSGDRAFMQFSLQHDHAGGGAGELRNLLFVFFAPGRVATSTASGLPIRGFTLYHASESAAMDADAIRAALGR